jgi:hypothetical protein
MTTYEIAYLAFVVGCFGAFMVLVGWAQYVTRDVGRGRAINPSISPPAESSSGLQTFKKAA